ncbi:hypothetical protein ACPCHT_12610 [Nucisporomicrobium flavum]|uniref:hypothetical protein n=1 Tax=Nucisporomicrobium flavum TaxID=2785915 RepID=UPI003C2DCCFF
MTLWRRTRTEVAGAWRSLRYDLGRREADEGRASSARPVHPDVTSTGYSTFGGAGITGGLRTSYGPAHARRPRRAVAVTAFGTLAVAGAAGSYFAVVNGLGVVLGDQPAGAEPYPLAAAAPDGTPGEASNEGLGRGPQEAPGRVEAPAAAGTVRTVPHTLATTGTPDSPGAAVLPAPRRTTVHRTSPAAPPTPCDCLTPPVPTPTAAPSSPDSPSPTPTPSPSDDDTASPDPTYSVPERPDGTERAHVTPGD